MNQAWWVKRSFGPVLGLLALGSVSTSGAWSDATHARLVRAAAAGNTADHAATHHAAPARGREPLPFGPGETLVYDVTWALVSAGTITLSLREGRDDTGAPAWHALAEGQVAQALAALYPLYYKAEALLDPATLQPRKAWVYQQEGQRRRTRITVFDHAAGRARFEQVGGRRAEFALPADAWDSLSVLYALRAKRSLAPGARFNLAVADGGRLYTAEVTTGAAEDVATPLKRFSAYRVTPVMRDNAGRVQKHGLTLWLSADRRRLPVRIEIGLPVGSFSVVLRSAQPG